MEKISWTTEEKKKASGFYSMRYDTTAPSDCPPSIALLRSPSSPLSSNCPPTPPPSCAGRTSWTCVRSCSSSVPRRMPLPGRPLPAASPTLKCQMGNEFLEERRVASASVKWRLLIPKEKAKIELKPKEAIVSELRFFASQFVLSQIFLSDLHKKGE